MTELIQMSGLKFGRWTVLTRDTESRHSWICECACGTTKSVHGGNLRSGKSISCGCHRKELLSNLNSTHNKTNTALYRVWRGIKNRCFNSNSGDYKNYGARGITVCEGWANDFQNFYE